MESNILKKAMITGLSTTMLIGGVSFGNLPKYNGNFVEKAYAATIKDLSFIATGTVTSNVSMRKGPGTSYARLDTLKKGTKVDIVAKSSNGWYKIKYKDGYNYVYSQYVNAKENNETNKDVAFSANATVNTNVYVRKTTSTSSDKLGLLKKGDKVTITAKSSDSHWYKINYKTGTGYVYYKYLTIKDNDNTKQDIEYNAKAVANHDVYVRKGSSPSSDKLGVLNKGDKVTIVAKSYTGHWYKINYKDGTGYVYYEYLTIKDNTDTDTKYDATGTTTANVYVRKAASTSSDKLGLLKKDTKVTIVAKSSNGWYKVNYKDGTGYVSSKYITIKDNTDTDTKYDATGTTTANVYVRKAASTSSDKLGLLKKGDKVTIVAKSSNGWYKVNYKDGTGYVSAKYVTIKDNESVKYPVNGVANHAVYVRKGASTSYSKLGTLQKNAKVTILSKTKYGWYKINYKNSTGYVYSQYIDVNSTK